MDSLAFDFDGTLINIAQRDYKVYLDILLSLGGCALSFDLYWKLRRSKTNIFSILSLSKLDLNNFDEFLTKRKRMIESPQYLELDCLFDSVKDTLDAVSAICNCYLVTTRQNKENTNSQLRQLGILDYFSKVYVLSGNKDAAFREIDQLKLVIGDTENDILPAKKLGIKSVAITTGIRSREYLEKMEPEYVFDDLSEIINIVISK